MGMLNTEPNPDFLPGTLEMLILQTLGRGRNHGYGIAQHIRQVSEDALQVGEGSLYPALQRLLIAGHVDAEWGVSENKRRARFYRITAAGRKQLVREKKNFDFLVAGIARVMEAQGGSGTASGI
jgi:PadR family transcriptional regulator, regulatory protein PadR